MKNLIVLQYTCMIVMFMLAFFTYVSRFYVTFRNRQFEQSRLMIVTALLLFVVHFMCQMHFGWRQRGDDVGVLFNLLFYAPSAILLSWSQLNILFVGQSKWRFMRIGIIGYILIVLSIVTGVVVNGSLHIGKMLYVADALHFATLLYYIWTPLKKLGTIQHRLDSELGNPADAYPRTVRIGLFAVCAEIVTESEEDIATAKMLQEIPPERAAEIEMAVNRWRSECGFRDSDLTLSSFARRIMINRTDITSYLLFKHGKNFRAWLSGVRIEEAKALMITHPEYSNEVVSLECGFSSRVYFQRLFKEKMGVTPAEWRRKN